MAQTPNELWGLIGGENGMMANCGEYGQLHEMMLAQLGIAATYEHLLATEPNGMDGKVRISSLLDPRKPIETILWRSETSPAGNTTLWQEKALLILNFSGQPNGGEGGVRVEQAVGEPPLPARFYTEARTDQWRVIGIESDDKTKSAEYEALWALARNFNLDSGSGGEKFQRWIYCNKKGEWSDEYVKLPGPYTE